MRAGQVEARACPPDYGAGERRAKFGRVHGNLGHGRVFGPRLDFTGPNGGCRASPRASQVAVEYRLDAAPPKSRARSRPPSAPLPPLLPPRRYPGPACRTNSGSPRRCRPGRRRPASRRGLPSVGRTRPPAERNAGARTPTPSYCTGPSPVEGLAGHRDGPPATSASTRMFDNGPDRLPVASTRPVTAREVEAP